MSLSMADIQALITLAKKEGLSRLKTPEVELEFGPPPAEKPQLDAMKKLAEVLASDTLSPEDALFMSSPQYVGDDDFKKLLQGHLGLKE